MTPRRKLLLIDDDEAVIEYLSIKLGGEFEIVATGSAEQALKLARETAPDLVLCDIDLPGMDGGDISATLFSHSETRHIPFLFLTALITPADLQARGNQLGGRAAISKHATIEEIVARIRASLD